MDKRNAVRLLCGVVAVLFTIAGHLGLQLLFLRFSEFFERTVHANFVDLERIKAECKNTPDTRHVPVRMLSDILNTTGSADTNAEPLLSVEPHSVVSALVGAGILPTKGVNGSTALFAVSLGSGGNVGPAWPLFSGLGSDRPRVPSSPWWIRQFKTRVDDLPVTVLHGAVTPQNAVHLLQENGVQAIDVLKVDASPLNCDIVVQVLHSFRPGLVITAINPYFPPPIKMRAVPVQSGSARDTVVYDCSAQFFHDEVMRPKNFVLLQQDWANVLYAPNEIAASMGMPAGVGVQAAYHRGYTMKPNRLQHMPPILELKYLVHMSTHEARVAAALHWASSAHKKLSLGCGSTMVSF